MMIAFVVGLMIGFMLGALAVIGVWHMTRNAPYEKFTD